MSGDRHIRLVAGLGNPGDAYAETRHNIGFMAADAIAETFSISFEKKKFDTVFGRGRIRGTEIILVKPMAFMNLSGGPVRRIADYFRISGRDMIVLCDDMDLAFGRIKIKEKGGDGGHKGLRSLIGAFGGGEFIRLRMGVGRPDTGSNAANYVLGRFGSDEKKNLDQIIGRSRDAVATILCKGAREGMNRFNSKSIMI